MITVNLKNVLSFTGADALDSMQDNLLAAHELLTSGTGPGADFLGWLRLPELYSRDEFSRIKKAAEKIKSDSDVLVVIGIGGSYLGSRAAIEFLKSPNYNLKKKDTPEIYFAGCNLSAAAINDIIEIIGERDFSVNIVSKSGTTTEPAVAFRIFKNMIENKYGRDGAAKRIYATTDAAHGTLKGLADDAGYESFVVPDDIGGRFSVLTAVGLLPMAVAGIDIGAVMSGAEDAMRDYSAKSMDNPVWQYAAARNYLYRSGKKIELLCSYEPAFRCFSEWWKQLYGESEGKDGLGLYPASVEFTADLHSMGQYIQQGERHLFETVVTFKSLASKLTIPEDELNIDGLNFAAGNDIAYINDQACNGVVLAHVDGGVPNIMIELADISETSMGRLIYFFELVCGISGYMLGVNPFDQPGVEAYKQNMFGLLGKPGYEELGKSLRSRL